MPKTKNAFAFRDFNEEKILQRPYFKKFNLPKKTDTEILESLQATGDDSVDDMEQKLNQIKSLHEHCKKFQSLIIRHTDRVARVKLVKEKAKSNKISPILLEYVLVPAAITELMKKLANSFYELESRIQERYQKDLARRLSIYRKEAGLTQKELGELVNISQNGMSRYLSGKRDIPTYALIRFSKILKVSTDELLGLK